jgi:3-dehydroquinate dehydratase-2
MKRIVLLNGPNLALLGKRQPEIYGTTTLADVESTLRGKCLAAGVSLEAFQHDVEGELVSFLGRVFLAQTSGQPLTLGIIFNPGAYTHTSIALRDACEMVAAAGIPIVEVHVSNIFAREAFRHHSHISPIARGVLCGFGARGYELALDALLPQNGAHE